MANVYWPIKEVDVVQTKEEKLSIINNSKININLETHIPDSTILKNQTLIENKQKYASFYNFRLNEIFEYFVDKNPLAPAIISDSIYLNYLEVEAHSNKLARLLKKNGIGPGSLVGIYFHRSEKPIISILGILKAGAAYVPIDSTYPVDRINYILDYANISILLTEEGLQDNIDKNFPGKILSYNNYSLFDNFDPKRILRDEIKADNNDLSYVLFTSGTTGRPKGIATEHRNVARFSEAFNKICEITPEDRIYQGFSLAFDGSVEEMWMALASGASLVVGKQEYSRLGDETADYMNKHQVTVFSTVPTFLNLIKKELINNRLLIVSGEPCPPFLVNLWSTNKRKMLNVYGPTETTVNTTVKECFPNQKVTIGKAIPGYETYILDENMKKTQPGVAGELYIGGIGVAREYYNAPDLTEKAFVSNPFDQNGTSLRLYKTGDLVKEVDGEIHFITRIDTQVKIRGFRIELSEIEEVLQECSQIESAILNVYKHDGQKMLAAYVVPSVESDQFDSLPILSHLKKRLPVYMIPSSLDLLSELPTLASGKADRKNLPDPKTPLIDNQRIIIPPENKIQENLLCCWKKILRNETISIQDDFFLNLRGASLGAVTMVSELRDSFGYQLSIRDIYNHPTIEKLSQKIADISQSNEEKCYKKQTKSAKKVFLSIPVWERYASSALQFISLIMIYLSVTIPATFAVWGFLKVLDNTISLELFIGVGVTTLLFGYPAILLLSIILKWIIIGRFKAGSYPLWGLYYYRWWIVSKIQKMSFRQGIEGTPLINIYYKLMGAKVGNNTIIDTSMCSIYDLVQIGDNASIGTDSQIMGYRIENGMLIIGTTKIGDNCYIGNHCHIGINSEMKDNSVLDNLSALPENITLQKNKHYNGSPAQEITGLDFSDFEKAKKIKNRPFLMGVIHLFGLFLLGITFVIISPPSISSTLLAYYYEGPLVAIGVAFFWSFFGVIFFGLLVAGIKALWLNQTRQGIYSINSFYYFRKKIMDIFFNASSAALHTLYTTIYLPAWLRLLGTKIGKMAEISTISNMTPDLTTIENESFLADGSMVGGNRFYKGFVQFDPIKIGKRSFVGNNAMLPSGKELGDNCLLGVLSVPPNSLEKKVPDQTEWLGSPSFRLPHRNKITYFNKEEIFTPTKKLYVQRYIIDALRIMIPNFILILSASLYFGFTIHACENYGLFSSLFIVPIFSFILSMIVALSVVLLKKMVMGEFKPVIKPLWSLYIWFNELVNGAYETIGAPMLSPMLGTPFYNWYFRLMGL